MRAGLGAGDATSSRRSPPRFPEGRLSRWAAGRRWERVDVDRPVVRTTSRATGVALAIAVLAVVGPLVQISTAQPAVRFAQTASLVEHRSLVLDPYEGTLLVDKVERDGHVLSDKAPLQAFLAAPVYAAGRALGMESASVERPRGNLGLWWITLWSATVPAAVLAFLIHRILAVTHPRTATVATVATSFGTLLLPFAGQLYGHVLAATLGYAAWAMLRRRAGSRRAVVLAGALTGAAVAVEYPMAMLAVVLVAFLAWERRWAAIGWFAAGAVPFGGFLAWYQWAAFGSPFTHPYGLKPVHAGSGPAVTGLPRPGQALEVLLGSRGLWIFSPVTLAGLIGLVMLARRRCPLRRDGLVGLGAFAAFWLLQAGWSNPWGGEMPGPRYLIGALPFLAVGVAEVARAHGGILRILVVWSIGVMAVPLLTVHLVPEGGITVLSQIANFERWGASPPLFVVIGGAGGWLVYGVLVAVGVGLVRCASRREELEQPATNAQDEQQFPQPRVPAR